MLRLDTNLSLIKGINRRLLFRINKLEIKTVRDLLWHFPFRYEDFSQIVKIADLSVNQSATIQGKIHKVSARRTFRRHMIIIEAIITDETGGIKAIWFNQPYLMRTLSTGLVANFAGKIVASENDIYLANPVFESSGQETKHTSGLIPVYPETRGLTSKGIRFLMKPILKYLDKIEDFIPDEILKQNDLPNINNALNNIHFPQTLEQAQSARTRFAFNDLFLLQLSNLKIRMQLAKETALPVEIFKKDLSECLKELPFTLTLSQQQSLQEILNDIQKPHPMNRLLQGDVGSGKTVIAAIAAILTAKNNYQSAFMAPTEVLAQQHYKTFIKILGKLIDKWQLGLALLTSGESYCYFGEGMEAKIPKSQLIKKINEGRINIVIGTHALIQKGISFSRLAFSIVDEQHRFGVKQRDVLIKDKKVIPHFLSMSATPIPRTLSLTIFSDLDLSIINELPSGRKSIVTKIVAPANRQKAYQFIREQIQKGKQAFVICPRIEVTPEGGGSINWAGNDAKTVKEEYEKLTAQVFPDLKLAMLHGRMKNTEKSRIMQEFSQNKINILIATSVIEVGVDFPNATIMVIEGADRFGLAQLYQFRGRVGRGESQSFCFLFTDSVSSTTHQRLNSLLEAKNGFELAEKDLALRGPGEFLGQSQTGLPDLAMRSLNNIELIKMARIAALKIINIDPGLKKYPLLKERIERFQDKVHLE